MLNNKEIAEENRLQELDVRMLSFLFAVYFVLILISIFLFNQNKLRF